VHVKGPAVAASLLLLAQAAPARADDGVVRSCIAASTEGQTLRKQGKLLEARTQMLSCARDVCPGVVRSHCAHWLSEIEEQTPSVVVRAQGASGDDVIDARVAIDGKPGKLDGQPVPLDPGDHVIAVDAGRGGRTEERVLVAAGETSRLITLHLHAEGSPGSTAHQSLPSSEAGATRNVPLGAWILGGVGVASLGVATYFTLAAKGDLDDLQTSCSPHCTQAQTQPGRTDALAGDVLFVAGGAAVLGAVLWAAIAPSSARRPSTALTVMPLPGGGAAALRFAY
jgi:hypothetical protein